MKSTDVSFMIWFLDYTEFPGKLVMVNHGNDDNRTHSDETDTYTETEPENKYHVQELSISNITRYCLINFH